MREPVKALAEYREALEIDPNEAEAWYNLGLSLDEGHHPNEAAYAFVQAVRSNPGFHDASRHLGAVRNEIGIALLSEGRAREAVVQFEEAIRLLPDQSAIGGNLEKARAQAGEPNLEPGRR